MKGKDVCARSTCGGSTSRVPYRLQHQKETTTASPWIYTTSQSETAAEAQDHGNTTIHGHASDDRYGTGATSNSGPFRWRPFHQQHRCARRCLVSLFGHGFDGRLCFWRVCVCSRGLDSVFSSKCRVFPRWTCAERRTIRRWCGERELRGFVLYVPYQGRVVLFLCVCLF